MVQWHIHSMLNKQFFGLVCQTTCKDNHFFSLLGAHVDLIFVLFDPIGQALCKRTLTLVEQLNKTNPEKMHYYLAKADEAGSDRDRHRVLMQIVQNLCRQPEISKTNFDMPTIYLPNLAKVKSNSSSSNKSRNISFRKHVVQIKLTKFVQQSIMQYSVVYKNL